MTKVNVSNVSTYTYHTDICRLKLTIFAIIFEIKSQIAQCKEQLG
jgi:hypothetical protein